MERYTPEKALKEAAEVQKKASEMKTERGEDGEPEPADYKRAHDEIATLQESDQSGNSTIEIEQGVNSSQKERPASEKDTKFSREAFCFIEEYLKKYETEYSDKKEDESIQSILWFQKEVLPIISKVEKSQYSDLSDVDFQCLEQATSEICTGLWAKMDIYFELSKKSMEYAQRSSSLDSSELDYRLRTSFTDRVRNDVAGLSAHTRILISTEETIKENIQDWATMMKSITEENNSTVNIKTARAIFLDSFETLFRNHTLYVYEKSCFFHCLCALRDNWDVMLREKEGAVAYGEKAFRETKFEIAYKEIEEQRQHNR